MDIPAKLVIEKMEAELVRLKESMNSNSTAGSYRDHAQSIKTYCELLLESQHTGTHYKSAPVQHASLEDVKAQQRSDSRVPAAGKAKEEKSTIYDEGEEPESDSLLDF